MHVMSCRDENLGRNAGIRTGPWLPMVWVWLLLAVLAGPALSVTTEYRSIGTNAATLYSTGTVTATNGSAIVTFSGSTLPTNIGQGDTLVVNGTETYYILSRDSSSQVTLQTNATVDRAGVTYTIARAYTTMALWNTGEAGNLVTANKIKVGVCYNDGAFSAGVTISGWTTDSTRYVVLTVAAIARHNGVIGAGAIVDRNNVAGNIIDIRAAHTIVEWLEITDWRVGAAPNSGNAVQINGNFTGCLIQNLILHTATVNVTEGNSTSNGCAITVGGLNAGTVTIRNNLIYDLTGYAITIGNCSNSSTAFIQNCTVHVTGVGIETRDLNLTSTIQNCMVTGTGTRFSAVGQSNCRNNLSSDASAPGTSALINQSAANQYISLTGGSENFRLKAGADAIDAGFDLSGSFTTDFEGHPRGATWDIGADELLPLYWHPQGVSTDGNLATNYTTDQTGLVRAATINATDSLSFGGTGVNGDNACTLTNGLTVGGVDCTGYTGTLTDAGFTLSVGGNVTLVSGMTFTTTGTLTLSASARLTTGTKSLNNLTANTGTLTLGSAATVTGVATLGAAVVNGGNLLTVNSSGTSTIGGLLSGTGGLTKSGSGALTLSGANTFSGGVSFSAGTLNVNSTTALGATGGTFTVSGGTIDNTSGGALTLANNNAQAWSGNVTFTGSNALNLGTGAVAMNASRQVTVSASTLTVGGVISGSGFTLTKAGSGAMTLAGTNTFTGGTTLSAGTLNINNVQALGTVAGTFTISGGTIDTPGGAISTVSYPQAWNGNFTFTGSNTLNLGTGAVAMNASRQVTVSASTLTVGGVISGSGFTLTKAGSGAMTLSGTNTFTGGTTLSAGTLNINNAQALGTVAGTFTISGGTINTPGGAISTVNYPQAWNGDFTFTGSNTLNLGTGAVTLGANRQVTVSASTLTVGGAIGGGAATLTKLGTGTLVLNGVSTYSGQTTVSAGTLRGTGTLAGALSVAGGTVAGGSSGSTGTFNGGTTAAFNAAGTLATRIAAYATPGTDFDRLAQSGAVTLGGTSALTLDLTGLVANGTATGILTCTNTPVAFGSVTISNNAGNRNVTLQYAANTVNVVITQGGATLYWHPVGVSTDGNLASNYTTDQAGLVRAASLNATDSLSFGGTGTNGDNACTLTSGLTVGAVSMTGYTGTLDLGAGYALSTGTFSGAGTLAGNTGTLRISGATADFSGLTAITGASTSTVEFTGTCANFTPSAALTLPTVTVNGAGIAITTITNDLVANALTITDGTAGTCFSWGTRTTATIGSLSIAASKSLTVPSGKTLTVNGTGTTLTCSGTLTNQGSLNLGGTTFTVTGSTDFTTSGNTVTYTGQASNAGVNLAAGPYSNLTLNKTGTTFTQSAAALTVASNLTITAGTFASGAQNLNVAGNWANSGTYSGTNTVTLNGSGQSVSGATTFVNLVKTPAGNDTLTVAANVTLTITGTMTWQGPVGGFLTVVSNSPGTRFLVNPTATSCTRLLVRDSRNLASAAINPSASINLGNTLNWFSSVGICWAAGTTGTTEGDTSPVSWSLNTVLPGAERSTHAGGTDPAVDFLVRILGDVPTKLTVTGAGSAHWTAGATPGGNVFMLEADGDGDGSYAATSPSGAVVTPGAGQAPGTTQAVDLRFTAPLATTAGGQGQSMTATVTATAE